MSKREKKTKIPTRGRSLTIRTPEESTNAACNIRAGKYMTTMLKRNFTYHQKHHSSMEKENDPSSLVATIDFVEQIALFVDSTLGLVASFVLLVVAVVIYIMLEDMIDDEGNI